ncbi:hypothetical protein HanXRQr2_Chr11g0473951 [Helianthus annuus]|uniref:Uncharacterized protein n=1 Tax=Helianthus annuus TaxID=4232 RepID=A0A9K3HLG9_HELAN|nr:hypothetical protein HanXRQr2_Chr11g0473951 [Helianthus annuus]KAJ0516240.1 hypothetical protein HanHA89_Chr11g0411641 [Helianthus annuus]
MEWMVQQVEKTGSYIGLSLGLRCYMRLGVCKRWLICSFLLLCSFELHADSRHTTEAEN